MPHPLRTRRDGQDPDVRDAKVGRVKALPPGLPVAEELAPEGGLVETLPRNRHGAPVGFEEEVCESAVLRRSGEADPECAIRFAPDAVELSALADLNLPAEGQPQAPG